MPLHTARLVLDYDVDTHLNLGANVIFASGSYLHGNENNANVAGATNAASGEVINGSGDLMRELDRRLKVMDLVVRHMVVRVDEEKKVV